MRILKKNKECENPIKKIISNPNCIGTHENSIKYLDKDEKINLPDKVNALESSNGEVAIGLADGEVGYRNSSGFLRTIYCHSNNVCSIDINTEYSLIVSGSWDHKAIAYDISNHKLLYECIHPNSVWCLKIMNKNKFVTGCADGHIRIWENGILLNEIKAFYSPVRGLAVIDDFIYAIDNYGRTVKTLPNGKIIRNRDLGNLSFSMCTFGDDMIVTCGEDGMIYLLNTNLEIINSIKITNCVTVWDVKEIDGEIVACGSNGYVYYITIDDGHNEEDINENTKKEINENSAGKSLSDCESQFFKSENKNFKMENNVLFEQNSEGKWEIVGDVKEKYKNTFNIEFSGKQYTLSFNDDENVHEVADRFLNRNKLQMEFHDEIVAFIEKNFKGDKNMKVYGSINIKGIKSLLSPDHKIIKFLEIFEGFDDLSSIISTKNPEDLKISFLKGECSNVYNKKNDSIYDLEFILQKDKTIPNFVKLDIYRYLSSKKVPLNFAFINSIEIADKKTAKAFVQLLTNLMAAPPFNLSEFDRCVRKIMDLGLLTQNDCFNYFENKKKRK